MKDPVMKWMQPQSLLGQQQALILHKCILSNDACDWIQGFPRSGKTVLLVHAMEILRTKSPEKSMCFISCSKGIKGNTSTSWFELGDEMRVTLQMPESFVRAGVKFDVILVDDIEDLEISHLYRLKSLSDRLIIAGDFNQSIYDDCVSESDVCEALNPTIHRLEVAYRLTQSVQTIARSTLPNTAIADAKVSRGSDTTVVLAKAESDASEANWVINRANLLSKPGRPAVVILPKNDAIFNFIVNVALARGFPWPEKVYTAANSKQLDWNAINDYLREKGIALRYLGSGFGDLVESDKTSITYVMTYHSSKGLDFANVFLPQMNDDIALCKNDPEMEKRLFLVGVTRSRENLFISYSTDEPHDIVGNLPIKCVTKQLCEQLSS
jgi:UvrD-like helicase C-terminal domain